MLWALVSLFFRENTSLLSNGPGGIRTLDLFSAIEARSQLRYRPVLHPDFKNKHFNGLMQECQAFFGCVLFSSENVIPSERQSISEGMKIMMDIQEARRILIIGSYHLAL